jgi:metal-sulfur cluster biosynthetic enzyme
LLDARYFLFTHIDFDIKYNGDNVIEINVSTDPQAAVDISDGVGEVSVKFTYSVRWTPTTTTYDKRLQRYERFPLNPVHLEVRVRERERERVQLGNLAKQRKQPWSDPAVSVL